MLHFRSFLFLLLLMAMAFGLPSPVLAQEGAPSEPLWISTSYPSMVIGIGETVTVNLDVHSSSPQTVRLEVAELPTGWTAEFRGGGRIINSVFVAQDTPSQVELRVTPADAATSGTYDLKVVAQGAGVRTEFPVEFMVEDKVPAQLAFETEFPTIRSGPDSSFSFSTTLKNDGDEDISVVLSAEAPREFAVTFKSAGKDITNLPTDIKAGGSQSITVEAQPLTTLEVGSYPLTVTAQGENVDANISLTAEVVGQPQLTITAPDERLSGEAVLGQSNPLKLILRNTGNSPAVGVTLSASSPAGWTVQLDPEQVIEIPAEGEVEVTANVRPSEKAVAGDYMLTFRAQPNEGTAKSADFRITVQTSTLWGIAGIALIAVALGVVGLAVIRFGRR
jgi:uncharacterized membrane protein